VEADPFLEKRLPHHLAPGANTDLGVDVGQVVLDRSRGFWGAAGEGCEPSLPDPESGVVQTTGQNPLHYHLRYHLWARVHGDS
jgi:hypothetical protein